MFTIENDDIRISQGDASGKFAAVLTDRDGEPYVLQQGDSLALRVKKRTNDKDALIEIFADAEMQFELLPEHTANLGCGSYVYDLCFRDSSDEPFHPIWTHDFIVEATV